MHKLLVPALLVLFSAQAHALSCIEPKLDQKTYDSAVLVFEGHLTPDTEVHADDHGHGEEIKTYTFTVDKLWKGDDIGETVEIVRDTSWGPAFRPDTPYLVVAYEEEDGFEAPICGNTMPVDEAVQQMEFLRSIDDKKAGDLK